MKVLGGEAMKKPYTPKQGQYLAFLHYCIKVHRRPPAEWEMQEYFRVSPPSVHQMILTLESRALIERTPGQARSIRLLIPPEDLPALD
jgi:DNA-binding MarR family transcriptional regulator